MSKPTGPARIPALDGIRAAGIITVLVSHSFGTRNFPTPPNFKLYNIGEMGLNAFFVISGYLISTLLLAEHAKTGTVSIKEFYVRRCYRIFPAFYFFFFAMLVAMAIGWIQLGTWDIVSAATYTMNFHHGGAWWLGHLWSLSVEEQFYFLWPAAFVLFGTKGAFRFAVISMILAPVIRVAIAFKFPQFKDGVGHTFPTCFDAIATGCVFAFVRPRLDRSPRYLAFLATHWFWLVGLTLFAAKALGRFVTIFDWALGQTIQSIAWAIIVDRCIRHIDGRVGRALEWRPVVWVGGLSYSLYLWQQPFLNRFHAYPLSIFPISIASAFAFAMVSHYGVEQPFLRLRERRQAAKRAARAAAAAANAG